MTAIFQAVGQASFELNGYSAAGVDSKAASKFFAHVRMLQFVPFKTALPFLEEVLNLWALHCKKGADYGTSEDSLANVRSSEEFGLPAEQGIMMRMNDKMIRLKSFCKKGSLQNESVEDSLKDIAVYAILALLIMRERQGKLPQPSAINCEGLEPKLIPWVAHDSGKLLMWPFPEYRPCWNEDLERWVLEPTGCGGTTDGDASPEVASADSDVADGDELAAGESAAGELAARSPAAGGGVGSGIIGGIPHFQIRRFTGDCVRPSSTEADRG